MIKNENNNFQFCKKNNKKTKPKIKTKPRANIKISLVYCKLSDFSIIIFQNEILF